MENMMHLLIMKVKDIKGIHRYVNIQKIIFKKLFIYIKKLFLINLMGWKNVIQYIQVYKIYLF